MRIFKILGIYSILYFLAYLAKKFGHAGVSSILFLFLALFLYFVEKKEEKSNLPLCGLFALGLLGGEGIAVLQLSTLSSSWTMESWLSFYLAYFIFYLLYYTVKKLAFHKNLQSEALSISNPFSSGNEKQIDIPIKDERKKQRELLSFLKLCILVLLGISYLCFFIEAKVLGYVPLFTEHTPHAYSAFHLKGLHYFTTLFVLVPMLLPFLMRLEKRITAFGLISFFLSLLLPILLVSRFQLLFSMALYILSLLLLGYSLQWKKALLLFLFLLTAYIVLTVERAHSVSYLLDIFAMKNKNIPIFFVQPYMYIANNYENFNLLTKEVESHSHGFRMAYPFLTLSGLKYFVDLPLSYPLYLTKEELSTLGILYDAYYDFGILGVGVFSAVLGSLAAILSSLMKRKDNPFLLGIIAQFAFYLSLSFFTTWFSNASSIFYFGISLFFTMLWQWKKQSLDKDKAGQMEGEQ